MKPPHFQRDEMSAADGCDYETKVFSLGCLLLLCDDGDDAAAFYTTTIH